MKVYVFNMNGVKHKMYLAMTDGSCGWRIWNAEQRRWKSISFVQADRILQTDIENPLNITNFVCRDTRNPEK